MRQRHSARGVLSGSAVLVCLGLCGALALQGADPPEQKPQRIYELRTYVTHPGRLDALHARFRDHTMRLFEKHGMTNVIYFVPVDQEETLVYLLAHDSREAADQSWKAFRGDPEWQQVARESEKDGRIVKEVKSQFLATTAYSPALPRPE